MRMALAYALADLSLKDVAAWASAMEMAVITGPGLFYRLREAETWLARVLAQLLGEQLPQAVGGWPVRWLGPARRSLLAQAAHRFQVTAGERSKALAVSELDI